MTEFAECVVAEIAEDNGAGFRIITYRDYPDCAGLAWTDDLAAGYVIDGDGVRHDLGSGWVCPFDRATWDLIKAAMDTAFGDHEASDE